MCQREGHPVAWDQLVKGYEYKKGQFVVLTKEDFEAAALKKSDTIDILAFVNEEEIDDRYYETPYYLVPGKGADRSYALLREAIRKSDKVGIAKIILRNSQHLAALSAVNDALVLTMMRFADELVDIKQHRFPGMKEIRSKELQMAESLINNLSDSWAPDKYTDDYRANLMRVINAKLKGQKPELKVEETPVDTEVIDLMDRLRQSLTSRKTSERDTQRARRPKRRKASRRAA
jgi:DNA end-binding protein Ku